jgi:hypothetical protein
MWAKANRYTIKETKNGSRVTWGGAYDEHEPYLRAGTQLDSSDCARSGITISGFLIVRRYRLWDKRAWSAHRGKRNHGLFDARFH